MTSTPILVDGESKSKQTLVTHLRFYYLILVLDFNDLIKLRCRLHALIVSVISTADYCSSYSKRSTDFNVLKIVVVIGLEWMRIVIWYII